MKESDRQILAGCIGGTVGIVQFLMIGVICVYCITHW